MHPFYSEAEGGDVGAFGVVVLREAELFTLGQT